MRKKPMLAYPANAKPIDYSKPTFIQPKLDGVRCVIQAELIKIIHEDYVVLVTAYSRTGKEWKNINHILGQLRPFFDKFPNVVLDGELYNHDLRDNFEKIISLVRKTKPTDEDRLEASKKTQFHCYDIIDEELPFDQRIEFVHQALMLIPSVYVVETHEVLSERFAKNVHKINLKNGYEGSIVRTNDTYQCKRSHNLRKFKDFHDAEAQIIGYETGKGYNYKDMKYMLENIHEYMGQTATFTYFEITKAGSYRHPLFKTIRDYE